MPRLGPRLKRLSKHTLFSSSNWCFFEVPYCQIDIRDMKTKEKRMGSQPPLCTLAMHAKKYSSSTDPNMTINMDAAIMFCFQTVLIMRNIKQVVTNITVITARPADQTTMKPRNWKRSAYNEKGE